MLFFIILLLILALTGALWAILKLALAVALGVIIAIVLVGALIGWRVRRFVFGTSRRPGVAGARWRRVEGSSHVEVLDRSRDERSKPRG
jgi:hypothetical protein